MENRFNFKDFLICGLVVLAIAVAALSWVQILRQGEVIDEVHAKLEKQDALLTRLDELAKAAKAAPDSPSPVR